MTTMRDLRQAAGLSQEKLAELAGTSQPQINKLETGQRKMTVDWAVKLAHPLGVEPTVLLGLDAAPGAAPAPVSGPAAARAGTGARPAAALPLLRAGSAAGGHPPSSMPVRAAARGGVDQEMFLEDGPIDWIARPDYLKNARDPYAMYVVGDSMMPRFRPAQLLHVNPHKPPSPGSGVVVVKRNRAVLVKEFVRRGSDVVVLREYQPADREFAVALADLDTLHTVVGLQEP
ncbi:XRE family transcriptional regulator [Azospirillum picis]|uniref:Phage repressor protein C with HTH and peptisase S24 domain n=1 Tax=Azospirillum picis TaxID=488438 RepID=A0ABU0MIJ8_9PROT|nr:LexA family transcriptional regulator [Azospirillum picis]MBP2299630.1 phage repressor protein C with HTH and peptisase S24 domain [Azospirillum picis]MDQ0533243.1 phage repressor protein C with HTH and peptisase S24 domain [Azospirillum picis]